MFEIFYFQNALSGGNELIKSDNQDEFFARDVSDMMEDKDFLNLVRQTKFDLAVVDSFVLSRILYILPYALDISFVSVTTVFDLGLMHTPFFPSFYHCKYQPSHIKWTSKKGV